MAVYVSCREVGIGGCEFETRGDEGEVLQNMIVHIRRSHGFDLPRDTDQTSMVDLPEPERMILSRIQRAVSLSDEAA